jgi:MFS family permease
MMPVMLRSISRDLALLFLVNIAFGLSMQMINPLFPLFLGTLGAGEAEAAYVVSAGNLASTLLMFPSGVVVDRFGKRLFLALNAVVGTVTIYIMAYSGSWSAVLPLYVAYSLVGALFVPARMAMVSENATVQNRALLFGLMNMAWPITGIISPVVSGLIVEATGWRMVYLVSAAVSALSLVPALMIRGKEHEPGVARKAPDMRRLLERDTRRVLFVMCVAPFLMTTAIGAVNLVLPLYLAEVYGLTPFTIGLFFTASNLITLVTQIPSGRLADRYDPKKILLVCTAIIPVFYALWGFTDNWALLLVIYAVATGLWSVTWPSNLTTLSTMVPRELQGAGFGINATGLRLGFTVGPLIGGYLYGNFSSSSPFLFAALSTALALPIIFLLKGKSKD